MAERDAVRLTDNKMLERLAEGGPGSGTGGQYEAHGGEFYYWGGAGLVFQ